MGLLFRISFYSVIVSLFFLVSFVGFDCFGQAPSDEQSLSWSESLKLARQNSPDIRAAWQALQAAIENERVADGGFYPTVTASLGTTISKTEPVESDSKTQDTAQLTLNQNLFRGFSDSAQLSRAKSLTEVEQSKLRSVEMQVFKDVKTSYTSVVFAREYQLLAGRIFDRRRENQRIVEIRYRGGRENLGALWLSEANTEDAKYDQMFGDQTIQTASKELSRAIGIPPGEQRLVAPKGKGWPLAPKLLIPSGPILDLAKSNPDYLSSIKNEEALRLAVKIEDSNYLPSLDFTGSVGRYDTDFGLRFNRWSAGLNLSYPIFNGGRDRGSLRSAQAKYFAAQANSLSVLAEVELNLAAALSDYQLSFQKTKVSDKFLRAAQLRADVARKKYNNGLMNFENWDIIENDLIQREKAALVSWRDFVNKEAVWQQLSGLEIQ